MGFERKWKNTFHSLSPVVERRDKVERNGRKQKENNGGRLIYSAGAKLKRSQMDLNITLIGGYYNRQNLQKKSPVNVFIY